MGGRWGVKNGRGLGDQGVTGAPGASQPESAEPRLRALLVVGARQVGVLWAAASLAEFVPEVLKGAFDVVTAHWNNAEQLERAYAMNLDLILIELNSQTLYGHNLIVAIRGRPELARVPILILSGHNAQLPGGQALRQLLSSLPDFPHDFLETPPLMDELLGRALALARARRGT